MSTKRSSKRDVDRFVARIDQAERSTRGYQIGLLYFEAAEYELAKRHVGEYMAVRQKVPQAHKLLGQIEEALQNKAQAIDSYKRSLELDGKQKAVIIKVLELYTDMQDIDPQILKYWTVKGESVDPNSPVVFKAKEKLMMKGGDDKKKIESFYLSEISKNPKDVGLHIKLMEYYLKTGKIKEAYSYGVNPEKLNEFINSVEWLENFLNIMKAYGQKEMVSTDTKFQMEKLIVINSLIYCHMTGSDIIGCVSLLHQFDQTLFDATQCRSSKPEWSVFLKEMQAQFFFLFGLLLFKRADKRQIQWRDGSCFAAVCFLISNHFPQLETRSSWYVQMNPEQKKQMDRIQKLSCYRLSQGGYLVLPLTQGGNLTRMKEYRQLLTALARDRMYKLMFTLREMRDKTLSSYLIRSDVFLSTPLMAPSKQTLETYDEGVFQLHAENLQELVWVAINRFSPQDITQGSYPLCIPDKVQFSTSDLNSGAPESLCQLDIQAFFYATVKCSALVQEDRSRLSRQDPYQPRILPACFSSSLCDKAQLDWWDAMYRFCNNLAKDKYAKLRLIIQKGIETVRLIGPHGMSVALIIHLARTFDERVKDLKAGEFDGDSACSNLLALERQAAHYWREATTLLSRLERRMNIPLPKERLFAVDHTVNLDENQIQELTEQAKFSLAIVAMREGHNEEACQQFETLKLPWASYYLSQIYRTMADEMITSAEEEDSVNQKVALVEQALEALYNTFDRIKGQKNHELHRIVPGDIDACVCSLESLRRSALGVSDIVESVSGYEDAREGASGSDDETPSFSTPTAKDVLNDVAKPRFEETPTKFSPSISTPAVKGKSPAKVHFSFSEQKGRIQPSPERFEARLWALEAKLDTTLDLMNDLRDQIKDMKEERSQMREMYRKMSDHILMCTGSSYIPPPSPYLPPPPTNNYQPPPSQYAYPQQPPNWGQYNYAQSYAQPMSPIPGGGPMSSRRVFNRQNQPRNEYEEDIYQLGDDLYEDDGSQPPPGMYQEPVLNQEWPFGNKATIEGKSTIVYSRQQPTRMPQPGFFANALKGQAIQYAANHMSDQDQKSMPGPGFFSSPKAGGELQQPDMTQSALAQALSKSVATSSPMPPNIVAGQPMSSSLTGGLAEQQMSSSLTGGLAGQPMSSSLTGGLAGQPMSSSLTGGLAGQPMSSSLAGGLATTLSSSGTSVPLFGSLVAASKSPDKTPESALPTSFSSSGVPSFASLAATNTSSFESPAFTTAKTIAPTALVTSSPFVFGNQGQSGLSSVLTTSSPSAGMSSSKTAAETPSSKSLFGVTPSVGAGTASTESSASPFASFSGFGSSSTFPSFGGLAAQKDKSSPFSTFGDSAKTVPAVSPVKSPGQGVSTHATPSHSPRKRNDSMEEYEPNIDFKPVIELPDLIEIRSGEEEEEKLFCERAKLFRFDTCVKQWKERGTGEMKILRHTGSKKSRILMRRDQVLKLCANHQIAKEMKLTPMSNSEKAWCWYANDYSEEELKMEQLAVRFINADIAQKFKKVFEKCQAELIETTPADGKVESPKSKPDMEKSEVSKQEDGKQIQLKELFKPKEGNWSCSACLVSNSADKIVCVACSSAKPGVDSKTVKETPKKPEPTAAGQSSLSLLFKPKTGAWSCDTCLVSNDAGKLKCLACGSLKPGVKAEDVKEESVSASGASDSGFKFGTTSGTSQSGGGFKFGTSETSGGFKFGGNSTQSTTETSGGFKFGGSNTQSKTETSGGFKFGDNSTQSTTETSGGFKFGGSNTQSTTETSGGFKFGDTSESSTSSGGLKFGTVSSGSGFKFGTTTTSTVPTTVVSTTKTSEFQLVTTTTKSEHTGSGFTFTPTKPSNSGETGKEDGKEEKSDTSSGKKLVEDKSKVDTSTKPAIDFKPASFSFGTKPSGFKFGESEPKTTLQEPDSTTKEKQPLGKSTLIKSVETMGFKIEVEDEPTDEDTEEEKNGKTNTGFQFKMDPKAFVSDKSDKTSGFQFKLDSSSTFSSGEEKKEKSPFKFTFTPPKLSSAVPGSPEVDKEGMYINKEGEDDHIYFEPLIKLPEKIDVVTGEENENVLFEHRAKLFRFHNNEWKERGLGNIKILENKESKKIRILMRREQILKICCNHYLTEDLDLRPMPKSNGKAWIWYAMDFSDDEPKCEQFSVRFKTPEIANKFKEAFDELKKKLAAGEPTSSEEPQTEATPVIKSGVPLLQTLLSGEDDVIIIKVEKATEEEIEKARKYLLPDHFYLYENAPPCPGCIGCDDYEPGSKSPQKPEDNKAPQKETETTSVFGQSFGSSSASGGLFDASLSATMTPGGLFGGGATGGAGDGASSTGLFGQPAGGIFGGSCGTEFSFSGLAAKSSTSPGAFQKDDSKPFSWSGAGQKLFGQDVDGDHEEGDVAQGEDPHFEPVVPLPDLVEVKTGEEDYDKIFCHRAKVYRFDKSTNQWKEKGIGEMKILQHKETGQYRLLLRREQVLKLACNQWLTSDLKFQPMSTSEVAWCWVGQDFSENEPKMEQLSVKFKNTQLAAEFKAKIDECQKKLLEQEQMKSHSEESGLKAPVEEGESQIEEEEEDDEEYEDIEEILLEKRVTFFVGEGGQWKNSGMGELRVIYDDDVNANKVTFTSDKKKTLCNHLIAMESYVSLDKKQRSCEWSPIDFSTDEPVRKNFRAVFSSVPAAEEFKNSFDQGCRLARDSEISENDMTPIREITFPEVHGQGAVDD